MIRDNKKKRILLVTGLKDKNKSYLKKPLVATGIECIKYLDNDFINSEVIILKTHWKKENLSKNFSYINNIYNNYLMEITHFLNKIHKVNYSLDYWKVIIGPWLKRFIFIVYDRLYNIKLIKKKYHISYVKINNYSEKDFLFNDYNDLDYKFETDEWNNIVYDQIIKSLKYFRVKKFNKIENNSNLIKKNNNLLSIFFFWVNKFFFSLFVKKNNSLFINTYFSKAELLLLQLKLRQIPFFPEEYIKLKFKKNIQFRVKKNKKKRDTFGLVLDSIIFKHFPKIYLEGYKKTIKFIDTLSWPKKPRFIFSSNSFFNDDVFKIYLAEQKRRYHTKMISGQHGGGFFSSKYYFNQDLQFDVSDFVLTWGFKNKFSKKFVPMFNFLTANKNLNPNYMNNHNLLFIDYEFPRFSVGLGIGMFQDKKHLELLEDRFVFFKKINNSVLNSTIVKSYPTDHGWCTKARFYDRGIKCKFSSRDDNFLKLLNSSKICVTNLNSTTFLQSLNLNHPTVIFFNKNIDLMNKEFSLSLKALEKVGIVFYTPEQAANHINLIWNSVDSWWNSKKVQDAVNFFCNKYSKRSNNKVNDLHNFFKDL
jgi:putative transferase (TIGR04331 family)